jgi:putative ABC transport system permease protein
VLGTGLALLLQGVLERFLGVGLPALELAPGPYLLAGLLGPALAAVAVAWPAWQASRRAPLDELLPGRGRSTVRSGRPVVAALILGLAAVLCRDWLPAVLALLLGGGVLALAALARPLLAVLSYLPLGLEARLALAQLERRPGRTGLTAGVLFLGLAATVGFEQALGGLIEDVRHWCRRSIVADFLVRGPMPDTGFVLATGLPDSLGEELEKLDGVARVERIAFVPARVNGRSVLVLARTFAPQEALPLDLRQGDPGRVRQGLGRGEAVLGEALAGRLGLGAGDQCTLHTPHGPVGVRVAGTAAEFAGGGEALYLEWRRARELLEVAEPHVFLVRAGAAGTLRPRLEAFCARRGLLLQSNAELRRHIDSLLARLSGAVVTALLLVFVVTSLGTASVLQRNVHEQASHFALLQALGLRRRQVGRIILWQAGLLAGLGLLPGALAGQVVALVIGRAGAATGLTVSFRPDFGLLAAAGAVVLGSALLAALWPARGAARWSVAGALR